MVWTGSSPRTSESSLWRASSQLLTIFGSLTITKTLMGLVPTPILMGNHQKTSSRLVLFLLTAVLTIFFGEGLIGSSLLWFANVWSLLVVLPLYFAHFLLLVNIAIRFRRTSLSHLYLLGILMALYEAWITKVLWTGYPGQEAIVGVYFGLALFEFLTLVLFYHPIFSFIIPLLVLQFILFHETNDPNLLLPNHLKIFQKSWHKTLFVLVFLVFYPASFLGALFSSVIYLSSVTVLVSWGLIFLFVFLLQRSMSKTGTNFSIYNLQMRRKGFIITISFLVVLYIVTFLTISPELIPTTPLPYLVILLTYGIVILLLHRLPTVETTNNAECVENVGLEHIYSKQHLNYYIILILVLPIPFALIAPISGWISLVLNLVMIVVGLLLIFTVIWKAIRSNN